MKGSLLILKEGTETCLSMEMKKKASFGAFKYANFEKTEDRNVQKRLRVTSFQ